VKKGFMCHIAIMAGGSYGFGDTPEQALMDAVQIALTDWSGLVDMASAPTIGAVYDVQHVSRVNFTTRGVEGLAGETWVPLEVLRWARVDVPPLNHANGYWPSYRNKLSQAVTDARWFTTWDELEAIA
jgi:hypothetical protein